MPKAAATHLLCMMTMGASKLRTSAMACSLTLQQQQAQQQQIISITTTALR